MASPVTAPPVTSVPSAPDLTNMSLFLHKTRPHSPLEAPAGSDSPEEVQASGWEEERLCPLRRPLPPTQSSTLANAKGGN